MNEKQAKKRIEELRKQTEYHAKKYYDDDAPEISDFEYDMLMLELKNLENVKKCNTLKNVCEYNGGLDVPALEALGLGNIQDFEGIEKTSTPLGQYGTLKEKSKGKEVAGKQCCRFYI